MGCGHLWDRHSACAESTGILSGPQESSSEEMVEAMMSQAGQGAGWGLFGDNLSQSGGFGREGNTGLMKVNQDLVGDSSRHVRRCPPQIQPLILGGLAAPSQMHSQPYNK